jgi:hypothetical protein
MFPSPIVRSGGLRQGSAKFYLLSFQAIQSLFFSSWAWHSPESLARHEFLFSPLTKPPPSTGGRGEGTPKNINPACKALLRIISLHNQKIFDICYTFKNSYTSLPISFLLLFIYFFSCVYTGYYSPRLVCPFACGALKLRVSRPGGAGHA